MGHSLPTWSCFCIYSYNLCLLAESAVSNIHNNYLFEETGEPCLRGLPGAWRQGLKRLMTCPSQSCSASTLAVQSVHCSKPSFSNTSLKSHAKAVVFILQFCFFFFVFWLHLHETIVPIVLYFALSKKMELKIPLIPLKQ